METLDERLTTVQIYYWMPDHQSLLQEFLWQCLDHDPEFPRVNKFLDHWKSNVEARIEAIYLAHVDFWGRHRRIDYTQRFEI